MSKLTELSEKLGYAAKELVEGMQRRVNRDPDKADYTAAFRPILSAELPPKDPDTLYAERKKKWPIQLKAS
jgi:hypothetical protein